MIKKIISWLLVIIWLSFIFTMSSFNGDSSDKTSKGLIYNTVKITIKISNKIGIIKKDISENEINNITKKLDHPVRKLAHMTEYFILAYLLLNVFNVSGIKTKYIYLIVILICFIYSCTDEYHQTYISGRSGNITDLLIDTSGSIIYILINNFINILRHKKQ